ncbi:MAG TPA: glycosyltransferase family 2 protein [Acidimicrobiales bacterium]|nr:glycosyltransferase family 2 protein [Acidimicrobiales bacterium]
MSRAGPPAPPVRAVVVAFGAPDLLDPCLAALAGGPPVMVVDNSSDAHVRSVVIRHRADYVDPGRNLGFAGGVNVGLQRHRGADILLVNPDATITPDQIAVLHHCLRGEERLACVAPSQVSPGTALPERVGWPFPTPLGALLDAAGLGRLRQRTDFLIGSVLLLRAEALEDVGPFDEQFFPLYAEETDWQRRARERGWTVRLCPDASATHVGAGTSGDPRVREVHFHAAQERYVRKHHGAVGWAVYRAAALAGALPRSVVLRGERRRLAGGRVHLYRRGPLRAERELVPVRRAGLVAAEGEPT